MSESNLGASRPRFPNVVSSEKTESDQTDTGAIQRSLVEYDLLLGLYRTLIEHADLTSGLSAALEIVCQFAGWDVGTAWLPSEDKQHIGLFVSWHQDDPGLDEFIGYCRDQIFSRGVGMPGRGGEDPSTRSPIR